MVSGEVEIMRDASLQEEQDVQAPSHSIVFSQIQDLVRTRNSLAARLKYALEKKENCVTNDKYDDLRQSFEEERSLHVQTKAKLVNREKELECALAKVTMLSQELETEKKKYREICYELRKSEEMRTKQNNALLEKCTEITEVCGAQDNILTVKDKKIRDLKERLARQNKTRRIAENETKLRLQQERYLIGHDYANPEKTELNREFNRFKGMLT